MNGLAIIIICLPILLIGIVWMRKSKSVSEKDETNQDIRETEQPITSRTTNVLAGENAVMDAWMDRYLRNKYPNLAWWEWMNNRHNHLRESTNRIIVHFTDNGSTKITVKTNEVVNPNWKEKPVEEPPEEEPKISEAQQWMINNEQLMAGKKKKALKKGKMDYNLLFPDKTSEFREELIKLLRENTCYYIEPLENDNGINVNFQQEVYADTL